MFAARGAIVYCADRHDRNLAETRDLITQAGGTAHVARADVSEEQDVVALVARIGKEAGRLDVAFNNRASPAEPTGSKTIQRRTSRTPSGSTLGAFSSA